VEVGQLEGSYTACQSIVRVLEDDARYVSLMQMCEPQLGRRGLYSSMGGAGEARVHEMAMLWVLNFSDGHHSLLDIAERSRLSFESIRKATDLLHEKGLLERRMRTGGSPAFDALHGEIGEHAR